MNTPQFTLKFTAEAQQQLAELGKNKADTKRLKAVRKTLGLMQTDLRHPSLKTHEYKTLTGTLGQKIFEAYAENKTPAAFRVFWYYGPNKGDITVVAITPHPWTGVESLFDESHRS